MEFNIQLCPYFFLLSVYVLVAVFLQQILKSQQLWSKIVDYLKIVVKLQSIVRTNPQKNNYNVIAVYNTVTLLFIPFHFLFINSAFKNSALSKINKRNPDKWSIFNKSGSYRLSIFLQTIDKQTNNKLWWYF